MVSSVAVANILLDYLLKQVRSEHHHILHRLIEDVFHNIQVELPNTDEANLIDALRNLMTSKKMYVTSSGIETTIQLYKTIQMQPGTILIGEPGCGKSMAISNLRQILNDEHCSTQMTPLNPKAIHKQIFGGDWKMPDIWHDGILQSILKQKNIGPRDHGQWIVFDGPLDASWADNLNTALDNSRHLCFQSGEQIFIDDSIRFLFEVDQLDNASPSFISRCGLIWFDSNMADGMHRIRWRIEGIADDKLDRYLKAYVLELFKNHFERCIAYVEHNIHETIQQSSTTKISQMCTMFNACINRWEHSKIELIDRDRAESILFKMFIWCLLWSIGGGLLDDSQSKYEQFIRMTFGQDPQSK